MYLHYHINIHLYKQTHIFLQHKHAGMKNEEVLHNFVIVYNLYKPQKTRTKKKANENRKVTQWFFYQWSTNILKLNKQMKIAHFDEKLKKKTKNDEIVC